ncbi:MAG TPA: hypothetical protein VLT36_10480 [Candidatus Dormibacteraeota bacterium]|nr:hypothetical protein [Candidatus Dormibacteraeota bacterium]
MKTTRLHELVASILSVDKPRRLFLAIVASAGTLMLFGGMSHTRQGLVVHEWGTFTSVQGADGALLDWRPLESSRLPGFVYDWKKPGLGRIPNNPMAFTKAGLVTLQRMETPVIYFYSDKEESVDVSVSFPKGTITEWYPQAVQIGPSTVKASPAIATLDDYAHKAGAKKDFTFATLLNNPAAKESRARWAHINVLPASKHAEMAKGLPTDKSGSHYFSARETDAAFLQMESLVSTNPAPETEKFIFYRGVGNFATPLVVKEESEGSITLTNTGTEALGDLFVMRLEKGTGAFVHVAQLGRGERKEIAVTSRENGLPAAKLADALAKEMAVALESQGLYAREAAAMVKTWKDSWFEEEGVRVLYLLPRSWTDQTLPLNIEPAPTALTRVMVGRAEVLTAAHQQQLSNALTKAQQGDKTARDEAVAQLRKLGRFAQPALNLAARGARPEVMQSAWAIYNAANTPVGGVKPL